MKKIIKLHDKKSLSRKEQIKQEIESFMREVPQESDTPAHFLTISDIRLL
jgi:hypothetical protein